MPGPSAPVPAPRTGARPTWPAAVSPLVADLVAGRERPMDVLAAFPTSLYLGGAGHERVLAVLTSDAVGLPIGLRLPQRSGEVRWGVEPGAVVAVGEGRVRLPEVDVSAVRLQRPARVTPSAPQSRPARLGRSGELVDAAHELTSAALAGGPVEPVLRRLVGAGRGLTPSGDDTLCGVLLTLCASAHPGARAALSALRRSARPLLAGTTSLSAALVVAAGEGYGAPEVVRLVGCVAAGEPATDDVLSPVLAIGHSSGADLVAGVEGAVRALTGDFAGPARGLDMNPKPLDPSATHPHVNEEGARRG